jgi:hypothetical protein
MARRARGALSVEDLECRALLSGITYSLVTDQPVYQVGQPIHITFTETNTGDQPVTVSVSPTDFTVSRNGGTVWQSDPENGGQPPTSVTLQPQQSVSQTATWDGTIPWPSLTGSGTTSAVNEFGAYQVTNPNAPQGDTAAFQITNPLQGALTTDQATYQVGQPVQLTFTETNPTDQSITILTANPIYQILHDGQPVLPVMDPTIPIPQTIAAGQTFTSQYTWNGVAGSGSDTSAHPLGQYVASVVYGIPGPSVQFTADFQVVSDPGGGGGTSPGDGTSPGGGTTTGPGSSTQGPSTPLDVASVSTPKTAYPIGGNVHITFQIDASGATEAGLPAGKGRALITIEKGSTVVWKANRLVRHPRLKTLATGQAIRFTTVWHGRPNQPGIHGLTPGDYTIDVVYGDFSGSTTIALGRKGR